MTNVVLQAWEWLQVNQVWSCTLSSSLTWHTYDCFFSFHQHIFASSLSFPLTDRSSIQHITVVVTDRIVMLCDKNHFTQQLPQSTVAKPRHPWHSSKICKYIVMYSQEICSLRIFSLWHFYCQLYQEWQKCQLCLHLLTTYQTMTPTL